MDARTLGGRGHVHRQVIRQCVDERVEALNGSTQRGGIGGIDAAGRNALGGELIECMLIAVECHDVVVAGFAQHVGDGVTDQTCANNGYFHALLLVLCLLSPAWEVRCA